MQGPSQNQYSVIGKTIVIKGEITTSDPLHVSGRVEGTISAPAQRVTVGKEAKLKADVSAREVVVMGEVVGNLEGSHRVEIRTDGRLMGNLAGHRIVIEDGAVLKGSIDVREAAGEEVVESEEQDEPAA
jgi:cytoskeletal protein CcmA (bactofilin family)